MKIVIAGGAQQKDELQALSLAEGVTVEWVDRREAFSSLADADAFIDLLFEQDGQGAESLAALLPRPVIVNSVVRTLASIHPSFIRINGWPGFLRGVVEATAPPALQGRGTEVLASLGLQVEWLPDEPGLVSARVVASIINEAFFALEEGVSSREEINTAMKLGTAYPFGPFEWAGKIGLPAVHGLLQVLSQSRPGYAPAPRLEREALEGVS